MNAEPLSRSRILQKLRELGPLLRERGIARVDIFGSVAKDQARADSDVDLLVELSRPMGFEFFKLQEFIAKELGVPVDLTTRGGLRPRVLAEVEKTLVRAF